MDIIEVLVKPKLSKDKKEKHLKVKFEDAGLVALDHEEQFYANREKLPKDAPKGAEDKIRDEYSPNKIS